MKIFEFDGNGDVRTASYIGSAQWSENEWRLKDVKTTYLYDDVGRAKIYDLAIWKTDIGPETLSVFMVQPEQLSSLSLSKYISHLESNSQSADRFRLAYWTKISMPLLIASLVPFAVPFAFGSVRAGSQGTVALIGVVTGLVFLLLMRVSNYLVLLYDLPAFLSAVTPIVVACLLSYLFFRPLYSMSVR
jgi:lipopolysaccharide export system permease protein